METIKTDSKGLKKFLQICLYALNWFAAPKKGNIKKETTCSSGINLYEKLIWKEIDSETVFLKIAVNSIKFQVVNNRIYLFLF